MLKFERRKLSIDLYGKGYSLTFPSVKQAQDYSEKANGADDIKSIDMMIDFLDTLGLPKSASQGMEAEHLLQIAEALMSSKKK